MNTKRISAGSGDGSRREVKLDLLLHVMHHGYGSDQDNGRNYLVRVKASASTAVSIAGSFQVSIDRKALGEIALSAPLRENIVSDLFAGNQFSVQRLKFQHSTGEQTELSRSGFGIVIWPFSDRTAVTPVK